MFGPEGAAGMLVACALTMTDPAMPRSQGNAPPFTFTGTVVFAPPETGAGGPHAALVADVQVRLTTAGRYSVLGTLQKEGAIIASRPRFESAHQSRAELEGRPGTYTISMRFSGEQIYRSGKSGPYELVLYAVGEASHATSRITTPPYRHTHFGELGAALARLEEAALDEDGDGALDVLEVRVELDVRIAARYRLQASLAGGGATMAPAAAAAARDFAVGAHRVRLRFAAAAIRRTGVGGPYEILVNLLDAAAHHLASAKIETRAYPAGAFGRGAPADSTDRPRKP